MFDLPVSILGIIGRTVVVYLVVLVGLRLAGKREIGQLTVFDLVVLLLLSNAVQNAMVGPDSTLLGGLIAAVVLLLLNAGIAQLRLRSTRLRHLVEGTPTVLVLHGQIISQGMQHEGLDGEMLEAALREHGVAKISEVEMAVLETDGSISVVPAGQETKRVRRPLKYLRRQ